MAKRNGLLMALLEGSALQLALADSSDDETENQIWEELEENVAVFTGLRYSYRGSAPKNLNWFDKTLQNLDDKRFKTMLRVSRVQFNVILALIEHHPVFNGRNSEQQFSTQFQLALVLYRLGLNGDGATLAKIATLFGIGDGGTIDKVTSRVFESVLSLEKDFLKWPSADERKQLVIETFNELPHCIRYVDGSEIELKEKPVLDHESYYSRSKQYSLKLQAVCDHNLQIRQLTVGYHGSAHNARIYNNCRLATRPQDYFCEPQYLAGDSAYKLLMTVLTPFRRNATVLTPSERTNFNKIFCSYRVRIEHCFGILKEIFASLKLLSIKIKDEKTHKFACTWIRVCCILRNVLRPYFSEDDLNVDVNTRNMNEDEDAEDEEDEDDELAYHKRIALVRLLAEK